MKHILIIAIIVLSLGAPAYAQRTEGGNTTNNPTSNSALPTYTLLEPLPCVPSQNPAADDPCTQGTAGELQTKLNFKYYVQYLFNLAIALGAVAAVFMIVWGGFQYMSTDSWQGKGEGLEKVKNALLGLLLVLTSYIILRTIDPRLVEIPSSLVPPLSIKYESVSSGILGQLSKEASSFRTGLVETQKKIADAEKKNADRIEEIGKISDQIEDLKKTSGLTDEDPEIKALLANIDSLRNEMGRELVDTKLYVSKQAMDSIVYKYGPSVGLVSTKDFNWSEAAKEVDRVYIQQISALKDLSPEPDQVQALVTYKDYSLAVISINSEVAKVVQKRFDYDNLPDATKSTLVTLHNTEIQKEIEKVNAKIAEISQTPIFSTTDPVLKKQLFDKIREAKGVMSEQIIK